MQMNSVNSSNISSIGYENGTLYVRFNSGAMYAYSNVPEAVYAGLMSASSHGSYLARNVKGVYAYHRIG